jgi:hypothetical protein
MLQIKFNFFISSALILLFTLNYIEEIILEKIINFEYSEQ